MRVGDLEIASVILCDDIRKEVTNKEILIGVYAGDIVISSFPAMAPLAFWIELIPHSVGKHDVILRLGVTDKKPIGLRAILESGNLTPTSIALAGMQIQFDGECDLTLEVKSGEEWHLLKRKKVVQGPVVSNTPIPTAS